MHEKFSTLPKDSYTKILLETTLQFGNFDCVLQKWSWDGFLGTSLIFIKEEVKDYPIDQLKEDIKNSELLKDPESAITVSDSAEHAFMFVNFNFEEEESTY